MLQRSFLVRAAMIAGIVLFLFGATVAVTGLRKYGLTATKDLAPTILYGMLPGLLGLALLVGGLVTGGAQMLGVSLPRLGRGHGKATAADGGQAEEPKRVEARREEPQQAVPKREAKRGRKVEEMPIMDGQGNNGSAGVRDSNTGREPARPLGMDYLAKTQSPFGNGFGRKLEAQARPAGAHALDPGVNAAAQPPSKSAPSGDAETRSAQALIRQTEVKPQNVQGQGASVPAMPAMQAWPQQPKPQADSAESVRMTKEVRAAPAALPPVGFPYAPAPVAPAPTMMGGAEPPQGPPVTGPAVPRPVPQDVPASPQPAGMAIHWAGQPPPVDLSRASADVEDLRRKLKAELEAAIASRQAAMRIHQQALQMNESVDLVRQDAARASQETRAALDEALRIGAEMNALKEAAVRRVEDLRQEEEQSKAAMAIMKETLRQAREIRAEAEEKRQEAYRLLHEATALRQAAEQHLPKESPAGARHVEQQAVSGVPLPTRPPVSTPVAVPPPSTARPAVAAALPGPIPAPMPAPVSGVGQAADFVQDSMNELNRLRAELACLMGPDYIPPSAQTPVSDRPGTPAPLASAGAANLAPPPAAITTRPAPASRMVSASPAPAVVSAPMQPVAVESPGPSAAVQPVGGFQPTANVPSYVWRTGSLKLNIVPRPDGDGIWEVWSSVERLVKMGHVLMSYSPADDGSALEMTLNISQPLSTQQIQEAFPGVAVEDPRGDQVTLRLPRR